MEDVIKHKTDEVSKESDDHDVFHVVDDNDQMVRYSLTILELYVIQCVDIRFKVDSSGNILSKRILSGFNLEAIKNVRSR